MIYSNNRVCMIYDKNVFIDNKYYKVYEKLINKRLQTPYKGEGEKHHYIPKSIIPNNDLVFLSYREHYVAHLLLVKAVNTSYKEKMLYAVMAMKIRTLSNTSFNSHLFDALKIKANISRSIKMRILRIGNPVINNEASRQKRVNTITGSGNPFYGKKHSEKSKLLIGNRDYAKQSGKFNANAKKVKLNGTVYDSVKAAAYSIGISDNTLRDYFKGRSKTCKNVIECYYCVV